MSERSRGGWWLAFSVWLRRHTPATRLMKEAIVHYAVVQSDVTKYTGGGGSCLLGRQTLSRNGARLPPLSFCREMERREAQSSEELRQLRQRAAQHGGSLGGSHG